MRVSKLLANTPQVLLLLVSCASRAPSTAPPDAIGASARHEQPAPRSQRRLTDAERAVEIVLALARGLASRQSAQQIASSLDGSLIRTADGAHGWRVSSDRTTVRIWLYAPRASELPDNAEVALELGARLRLKDLSMALGPFDVVHESKSSSVEFKPRDYPGLTIFGRLFESNVHPDDTLVSVSLRRP